MIKIRIDNREVEVAEGITILAAAAGVGIDIPTLCYMEDLKPYGSCFICVVEVEGNARLLPACSTICSNGMVISTRSDRVIASRRSCIELIMSDHVGDCRGPCEVRCPAGIDIPGFISLINRGEDGLALQLIKESLPFPASLGRVCPRPCEEQCRRRCAEDPVSICYLKRYVADGDLESENPYIPSISSDTGKRVAIVGAGPAGLSASFYLRKLGHEVLVLDSHDEPGGMLRYGIPEYRLPREVLSGEIDIIREMGVRIECGKRLGRNFKLDELLSKYDAVFLSIGAQLSSSMGIDGEDSGCTIPGIAFLDDVASGREVNIGSDVIVVGGGNTAIDAARTAIRLGSSNVQILYRRTRSEMPANIAEIEAAEVEGVKFRFLAAPIKIEKVNSSLELTCCEMELGAPDGSGRRRPVKKDGSEFKMIATAIISAIGQSVDADCSDVERNDIKLTRWNSIDVNPETFETGRAGLFAGGDCVSGADIAVTAIAAGRKAAHAIDQYLAGAAVVGEGKRYLHLIADAPKNLPDEIKELVHNNPSERRVMPELDPKMRRTTFDEVERGFSREDARSEAARCLACGCRSYASCAIRKLAIEYGAEPKRFEGANREFYLDDSHPRIRYESNKCIMCATCVRICAEVKGLHALQLVGRGFGSCVRPILSKSWSESPCDGCFKCVPACPTGAISFKVDPADEFKVSHSCGRDASKFDCDRKG